MEVKVVVSYPDGRSEQKELRDEKANSLLGKKIGDIIEGGILDVQGDLMITGGSDRDGFAMKKDIDGPVRRKVLLSGGVGFNPTRDGERRKKRVRGNMITTETIQVNTKVIEQPTEKKEKPKKEKPKKKKREKEKPKKEKKKPEEEIKEEEKPGEPEKPEKPEPELEKEEEAAEPEKEPEPEEEKVEKGPATPLTDVKGIGKKRAEKFEQAGIRSAEELLSMETSELIEKTGLSEKMIEKFKKRIEEK